MDTKFWVMEPNGQVTERTADWPQEPDYAKHLRPLFVEFGFDIFERVRVAHPMKSADLGFTCCPTDMIVDENGHAKGLKYNWRGTMLYATGQLIRGGVSRPIDPIMGTAILFDRPVIF